MNSIFKGILDIPYKMLKSFSFLLLYPFKCVYQNFKITCVADIIFLFGSAVLGPLPLFYFRDTS